MNRIISFDFDGVLFPSLDTEKCLFFLNKGIQLPINMGDRINLKLLQSLYKDQFDIKNIYSDFIYERHYLKSGKFSCDQDIPKTLDLLRNRGFKLNIITRRTEYIKGKNYTRIWLDMNGLSSFFDGVYFTNGQTKTHLLKSTSTSVYIDNDLDAILEYRNSNPLIKYIHWSNVSISDALCSVYDWGNFIKAIENEHCK